jgi:hypothetical protein
MSAVKRIKALEMTRSKRCSLETHHILPCVIPGVLRINMNDTN